MKKEEKDAGKNLRGKVDVIKEQEDPEKRWKREVTDPRHEASVSKLCYTQA